MLRTLTRRLCTQTARKQGGFTLIEMMITLVILMTVSAVVLSLTYEMTMKQASISNRSEMHASVRSVTEVLQQEISQAGRITFPAPGFTALSVAVDVDDIVGGSAALTVDNPEYLFDGIRLIVDVGDAQEVVTVTTVGANSDFKYDHPAGAEIRPAGAFAEGILPTSSDTVLQMYGDINDDGGMVYIEYVCAPDADGGTLTRQETDWDAGVEGTVQTLLSNVLPNLVDPDDPASDEIPCFTYQTKDVLIDGTTYTFVLSVGVTLSAKAQFNDLQTGREERETKALLNVSPRNVFQAWQLSGLSGAKQQVQPTPPNVITLSQ